MSKVLEEFKVFLDEGTQASMEGGGKTYPHVYTESQSRFYSFKMVYDHLIKKLKSGERVSILELGTSRSFKAGPHEGCGSTDLKYWDPNHHEEWDWSAGIFTITLSKALQETVDIDHSLIEFVTIDWSRDSCYISWVMTRSYEFVKVFHCESEDALRDTFIRPCSWGPSPAWDVIYMDTADFKDEQHMLDNVGPLHLREAQLIVEKNLLTSKGIILIDDVKNSAPSTTSTLPNIAGLGKSFLSIPYLKEQGFKTIYEGYQFVMSR